MTVIQERRAIQQGAGEPTTRGPSRSHGVHHALDNRGVQAYLSGGDQPDDNPDRVGEDLGAVDRHDSAICSGNPGSLRTQRANACVATGRLRLLSR